VSQPLDNRKILVVDDEPDVLETVVDVLEMCRIETARNFDTAQKLLKTEMYDMAILDIMGVRGLHLLDLAVEQHVPAVILTAPAFNPEHILKAMERGAISCFPKEDLADLPSLLQDLFDVMEAGDSPWLHTMQRLEPLLDERFSPEWKVKYKALWNVPKKS
jgi:DNA-binding NtrC family response regulator